MGNIRFARRLSVTDSFEPSRLDFIIILLIIAFTIARFWGILTGHFVAFFDFSSPASWMIPPQENISRVLANFTGQGYPTFAPDLMNPLSVVNSALFPIFGSALFPFLVIGTQILLAVFVYTFLRFFRLNSLVSLLGLGFVLLNPYTTILFIDDPINFIGVELIFPLLVFYFLYRTEGNILHMFVVLSLISLVSLYGPQIFLYPVTLLIAELAFVSLNPRWVAVSNSLKNIAVVLTIFIIVNLKLVLQQNALASFLGIQSVHPQVPSFNAVQILSFQALYSYQNTMLSLLPRNLGEVLGVVLLSFSIIVIIGVLIAWGSKQLNADKRLSFLLRFSTMFMVFAISFMSLGSDYGGLHWLIQTVVPSANYLDPWGNGFLWTFSCIVALPLAWTGFRGMVSNASPYGSRNSRKIRYGTNRLNFGRIPLSPNYQSLSFRYRYRDYKWRHIIGQLGVVFIVACVLVSGVPYIVIAAHYSEAILPVKIPTADEIIYNKIKQSPPGLILIIPSTHSINFNYSHHELSGIGNKLGVADVTFWAAFPPHPLLSSGPLYNQLLNYLYENSTPSELKFDNLATKLGLEYVVDFLPTDLKGYFAALPALSPAYIRNNTNFQIRATTPDLVLFKNPDFSGMAFLSNYAIVADNFSRAMSAESMANLSGPIINYSEVQLVSKQPGIELLSFDNSNMANNTNKIISLVKPIDASNVYLDNTSSWEGVSYSQNHLPPSNVSVVVGDWNVSSRVYWQPGLRVLSADVVSTTNVFNYGPTNYSDSNITLTLPIERPVVITANVSLGANTVLILNLNGTTLWLSLPWNLIVLWPGIGETGIGFHVSPSTFHEMNTLKLLLWKKYLLVSFAGQLIYSVQVKNQLTSNITIVGATTVPGRPVFNMSNLAIQGIVINATGVPEVVSSSVVAIFLEEPSTVTSLPSGLYTSRSNFSLGNPYIVNKNLPELQTTFLSNGNIEFHSNISLANRTVFTAITSSVQIRIPEAEAIGVGFGGQIMVYVGSSAGHNVEITTVNTNPYYLNVDYFASIIILIGLTFSTWLLQFRKRYKKG